jgi:hypothetical protein
MPEARQIGLIFLAAGGAFARDNVVQQCYRKNASHDIANIIASIDKRESSRAAETAKDLSNVHALCEKNAVHAAEGARQVAIAKIALLRSLAAARLGMTDEENTLKATHPLSALSFNRSARFAV